MISIETIKKVIDFCNDRSWDKYHNPKDLAIAISIEANELLEIFLWRNDFSNLDNTNIAEELADIFIFMIYFTNIYGFNIDDLIKNKINKNSEKYPLGDSDKW